MGRVAGMLWRGVRRWGADAELEIPGDIAQADVYGGGYNRWWWHGPIWLRTVLSISLPLLRLAALALGCLYMSLAMVTYGREEAVECPSAVQRSADSSDRFQEHTYLHSKSKIEF